MSTSTLEVFVATYGSEDGAAAAAKDFQEAQRDGAIDLIDAAVIVHTADGKVKFEETADPSGKKWAKRGAIAGGVVGLITNSSYLRGPWFRGMRYQLLRTFDHIDLLDLHGHGPGAGRRAG